MSDIVLDGLPYPVVLSARAAGAAIDAFGGASGVAVVYDAHVARRAALLAAAARKARVRLLGALALRGGERIKSVTAVRSLWRWLVSHGMDRASVLIAVGGGTLTDLAGFAAATYMRGVAWIAVPTTLLGMVDASIGGKTAIDLPEGKNLAGVFWPPRAVVADVAALSTLPRREMENGIAEVIKAGVIGDPALLDRVNDVWSAGLLSVARPQEAGATLEAGSTFKVWADLIAAAARVKIGIVAADPLESGAREALNLGHTFGHAIESASRGRLAHGRAVAIGLRGEGLLAIAAGLFARRDHARMLRSLHAAGLPLYDRALDVRSALCALHADKKRRGAVIRFTLPVRIGAVRTGVEVEPAIARRILAQCAAAPSDEELEV